MRHDKFTSKFQMAIADAQSIALGRDHQFIEPVHLMQALLDQNGGSVRPLFTMLGIDIPQFRASLSKALDALPQVEAYRWGRPAFSGDCTVTQFVRQIRTEA